MRRNRAETERRILQAVSEIITSHGTRALGINLVAQEAGCDKVLIYRYFDDLDGLQQAWAKRHALWWTAEELLPELNWQSQDQPLPDLFATMVERHIAWLRSHSLILEIMAGALTGPSPLADALNHERELQSLNMSRRVLAAYGLDSPDALRQVGGVLTLINAATDFLLLHGRHNEAYIGVPIQRDRDWENLTALLKRLTRQALTPE